MKSMNHKAQKEEKPQAREDEPSHQPASDDDDDNDDSDSSESDDDGELVLEGELVRNPDASSSSSDDDDDDEEEEEDDANGDDETSGDDDEAQDKKPSAKNSTEGKRKSPPTDKSYGKSKKKKKNKRAHEEDDLDEVEFIFCEMDEKKYWDGCKALLINASSVYQKHASVWTDWLMEQVLGTVVSTSEAYSAEDNLVFGFASFIGVQKKVGTSDIKTERTEALSFLQKYALDDCPNEYQLDMKRLFESQSCPLYVFLHGRMMNLPLEIVLILHQQLWLDWEHDQKNAKDDGKSKKKPKKNTAAVSQQLNVFSDKDARILRVAPCTKSTDNMLIYRYYEDELMARRAIVSYTVKAPPSYSKEQAQFLQVLLFTPENYQKSIKDLEALVGK